jgi:2,3-bisphosphoglycerate-independent phosphoglycerate mutase
MKKPVVLAILDGYGYNPKTYGNAIVGNSPNIDALKANNPTTLINASGMNVGLPDGQMGNSEVGHTNIGAGRIVYQELTRITKSILDGDFFTNAQLLGAIENCKKNNSALHLMGLLSDGGVHSHNTHLYALVELAKKNNIEKVFVHCLMDGRDVSPTSGKDFVKECEHKLKEIGAGVIATVIGRYYAMDRDNRWDRVSKAYAAIAFGDGEKANSGAEAVANSYEKGSNDEFILPTVTVNAEPLKENDSFIFFNFRPDRAREITRAFVDDSFDGFDRRNGRIPLYYVCMTQYDATMPNVQVAFTPQTLNNTFGEYLSNLGLKQLRIAETEKYAHVTFFFNGGVEKVYEGEDRVLIPSPKVATYDLQPEMSAFAVCDAVCERIESKQYDVIILNFANCDMVGHTGFFDAASAAVKAVDTCMGRVSQAVKNVGGVLLITADHGNADKMYEEDGSPFTAHTTNPVPFIVVGFDCTLKEGGSLADIAPTMLHIMGIEQPKEMSGKSLINS